MATPVLVTPRLTLSMHVPADLEECAALWSEPAVYEHIGGMARSREAVWQQILRYIGHWATFGYGYWIARETASGRLVGEMGLIDTRRATAPSYEGTPEAGWVLAPHAHGQGYAAEAMAAVLDQADAQGVARTMCIIDPANAPSLKLADRLGYALWAEGRYNDRPTLILERMAGAGASA